ncbi:MAG: hypothetical protein KAW66_14740, partial [Candidatus Lokiarchaeota archaeon]|nr:hypothetical protein [Candidatus Lokiarchaeota archaeon]
MIKLKNFKRLLLISIIAISSIYMYPTLFLPKEVQNTTDPSSYNDAEINYETTNYPQLSIFGEAPWW